MKVRKQSLVFLSIGTALTMGISGCGEARPPGSNPEAIVISTYDEVLALHTCVSVESDHFWVERRNLKAGIDWQTIWESDEHIEFAAGVTITTTDSRNEIGAPEARLVPEAGDQVRIRIDREAPEGGFSLVASTYYLPDDPAETRWLHANGALTDIPCDS